MSLVRRTIALFALLLFAGAFPRTFAAGPAIIDLGTLGGSVSQATAVNDLGQVVGGSQLAGDQVSHAFSWTAGRGMVDLGTLGGTHSYAMAVNNSGQVVGSSTLLGDIEGRAFLWTAAGGMVDLGTLGGDSIALGINAAGEVIGTSLKNGLTHAFYWSLETGMIDIGFAGGRSAPRGINDSGQVAGFFEQVVFGGIRPFVWTRAGGLIVIDTLSQSSGRAEGISNTGQVVGSAGNKGFSWTAAGGTVLLDTPGQSSGALAVNNNGQIAGVADTRATLWATAGGAVDLGTLGGDGSQAIDINDAGQIVGGSTVAEPLGVRHAFSWNAADGLIDLGTLGGSQSVATDINEAGDIAGWSDLSGNAQSHAVLWTTVRSPKITSLSTTPDRLWPPSHKFEAVTIHVSTDALTPATCQIGEVTVNQPMPPGNLPWQITGPLTLDLQADADRSGERVYTIEVTCVNSEGSDRDEVTVVVPHDSRRGIARSFSPSIRMRAETLVLSDGELAIYAAGIIARLKTG